MVKREEGKIEISKHELAQQFWLKPHHDISEAIVESSHPRELIGALLSAAGFPFVEWRIKEGTTNFLVGHSRNSLSVVATLPPDNQLRGKFQALIAKIFLIVSAIENELTDATLLPQDLRAQRIKTFCDQHQIDDEIFTMVLKNW